MGVEMQSEVIMAGSVRGELLVSAEPLSFWGGYDQVTGNVIDQRHPLAGQCAAGKILAVPFTRGSSTTTAVLLEAIKADVAPRAIVTTARDSFFALASIVADEMYGTPLPLFVLAQDDFDCLRSGQVATIDRNGQMQVG
ncbi:MAG: aconitase X swivel domain-containing protein [Candidatus Promineifilaceae bacterium]